MNYDENTKTAVRNLAAQLAESIEAHHFDPQLGQVWAALFIAGETAEAQELKSLLPGDVDVENSIEELMDLGAVKKNSQDQLVAVTDPIQLAVGLLRAQEIALVEELQEALDFAADKLSAAQDPRAQDSAEWVKQLGRNIKLLHQLLTLLNKAGDLSIDTLIKTLGAGLGK